MLITSGLSGSSAPSGCRFAREVIAVAVRWYLRYGLSYRDVEELLAGPSIPSIRDHVLLGADLHRGVRRRRPSEPTSWTYLYRAVDPHGQVIDVLLSECRNEAEQTPGPHNRARATRARSHSAY